MDPNDTRHRIGAMVELPQVLRELGHDPAQVIGVQAGIDPALLRNPEGHLSFPEVGRILEACVAATGCPHFAVLVAGRRGLAHLGLVGRLMGSAPTLGTALMDLCENQPRYIRGVVAYLIVQHGTASLGYTVHDVPMPAIEQVCEGAMAIGANMLRELAGVSPDAVLLARRAPSGVAAYRDMFGVMPQFDAEHYAVCFPARKLQLPVRTADPTLRAILQHTVSTFRSVQPPGIADRVTRLLHARATVSGTSLQTIAEALGLHPRTLNRRLLAEGTSFLALRDRARLQVARQLLAGTRMPVTQVALSVGYGEVSSFTHAFRRQSGIAPARWRQGVRPEAPSVGKLRGAGGGEAIVAVQGRR